MEESLGKNLLSLMGGESNIQNLTHCATRLRPTFKDKSKVDVKKIQAIDGVVGVVDKDPGFQIVIGTNVGDVYAEIMDASSLVRHAAVDVDDHEVGLEAKQGQKRDKSILNTFVQVVVSIFSPLLPLLAGSGLLRGFTILANEMGILSETSTTNTILTVAATSVFYFLPLLVAYTTAQHFKTSPMIAVAVMGALIMPEFAALMGKQAGTMTQFMGLSFPVFAYTSQVIPAIVTTWIQSKLEHWMKKRLPSSLHMIVIPTILLFLLVPLAAIVIGPAGNYLSIGMANGVSWLMGINTIISGAVIGGIWNILIMFGVHWAPNTMVVIPEIAQTGHSAIIAYGANANFGMAGAALAIFFMTRNKSLKGFSLTAITSVMLSGIVEPAIYGLGLRFKTPLVAGCLGAAAGGAFMGLFKVVGNAFVFGGLTTIPAFAGPTLWFYIIGLAISFVGGFALTWMFGIKEGDQKNAKIKK